MPGTIYHWMRATLEVPIYGTREERNRLEESTESVTLPLRPFHASLELNDHNQADGLDLTVDWYDAGVDPRLIDDGVVRFFAGNHGGDEANIRLTLENCRFVGVLRSINTSRTADSTTVNLSCVDYTKLFLEAKPFGSSGVPSYDQTLREAWQRVVSQTPGAKILADRIRFEGGVTGNERLGVAVSERFAKLARVPSHPRTDGWAVWQQSVGMLGLVSWIELDECVVSTATNLYTETDSPVLIWGGNVLEWHEERIAGTAKKGIMLSSYDPETGKTVEAWYPPRAEKDKTKKKKMPAVTVDGSAQIPIEDNDREILQFPGVTNVAQLEKIAREVYEERSRQELAGSVVTEEVDITTERGQRFDLWNIRAGESIRVEPDPEERTHLNSLQSHGERVEFLVSRGYTREAADLIVRGLSELHRLESKFYVKDARIELETSQDGGSFSVELNYVNRLQLSGDTAEGT